MVPVCSPIQAIPGRLGALRWTIFCGVDELYPVGRESWAPRHHSRGGENAAYALHRAFQASSGWQSVFLVQLLPKQPSVPVKTLNPLAPVAMNGC